MHIDQLKLAVQNSPIIIYNKYLLAIAIASLILSCFGLSPIGINPISPAHLTKGKITIYEFSFLVSEVVTNFATIDVRKVNYAFTVVKRS